MDAFIEDRVAMGCTPKTIEAYRYALGGFVRFLGASARGEAISPQDVRRFLVELRGRGLKDTTISILPRTRCCDE
jgi:site-specific recombinase XerD